MIQKIQEVVAKIGLRRAYKRCYNNMKDTSIATSGMCYPCIASNRCENCPYFVATIKK